MRSVDIDSGTNTAQHSGLAGLGKKLCGCCDAKASKTNPVELTKAEVIITQPTSSHISVAQKDIFHEQHNESDFCSVDLEVPECHESPQKNGDPDKLRMKEQSSNITSAVLDRLMTESDEVDRETTLEMEEEVSLDAELTDVVEEASDSEVRKSIELTRKKREGGRKTETASGSDVMVPAADSASVANNEDSSANRSPDRQLQQPQRTKAERNTGKILEETSGIFNERVTEMNGQQQTTAMWSPQKPPRRASQLLSGTIASSSEKSFKDAALNTSDDGSGDDISDNDDSISREQANGETIRTSKDVYNKLNGNNHKQLSKEANGEVEISKGVTKSSTHMYASCSFSSEEESEDDQENVTRLSVKSNGEVLVSSTTSDGQIVKVKLEPVRPDDTEMLTDDEFSERLI